MQIVNTIEETKTILSNIRQKNMSIGFVPTMGALHEGHLSLIRDARKDNDFIICSIYVNPTQFDNNEDLEKYPRDLNNDIDKLEKENCDLLFNPSNGEMYPQPDTTEFDLGYLDEILEGKYRPGHFNGVAIVVKKLFSIIEPDRAYFGIKDYQQLLIIQKLIEKFEIPVEIIPCPTEREDDGLAMSSRNARLSPKERKIAPIIYTTLKFAKINAGFIPINELKKIVAKRINKNKLLKLEYFEIVDAETLLPLKTWTESNKMIACIAVFLGKVRLIDNIILFY
ncbi:MAG: pantoate--beta-alanine ligase [Bacteroidales bacterium]|nr:pantoate--beta-alanine ligase [Bacteroidales bacterium]